MQNRASLLGLVVALLPVIGFSIVLLSPDPGSTFNPFGGVTKPAFNLLGRTASPFVLNNQYIIGLVILLLCLFISASLYYCGRLGCIFAIVLFLLLSFTIILGLPTHDEEAASAGIILYPFIVGFLLIPSVVGAILGKLAKKYLLKRFKNKEVRE